MVKEGLQEVIHTAARGESVTCVLLNNGVFGETGGHMTATTAIGQRTKNSLEGRDSDYHGHPIPIAELLAPLGGTAYVACGSVADARGVVRTKNLLRRAFESQLAAEGLSAGQMIDAVRLSVLGRASVVSIAGISSDGSGFGMGPLLDPDRIRERVQGALEGQEASSFVEILTMCPTGWFVPTAEGPGDLDAVLGSEAAMGEIVVGGARVAPRC